ncbi:U2 small nuclear ribonucleoprotein B [Cokeromyces recurvatus]|uniref:U2 small nuclear ribonucleoprotein B n=1 Tax=Cokeromyces recurvatus TaxID=90255 RepID=UPI0022210D76|nr:U2 small nuclear ribonucleoprotein B [Cokeromyces recurvatus]KAI7901322.1 U2 small nuclear ribonucleoprotein B [Cokeromyces recurvatus]
MTSIDPSQTLYVTNINGRINIEELKHSLYDLFSTYGPILDITAKKTEKMREQAFVVYSNVASATTAKRSLNGFTFFNKPLKIEYAKTKSDAVAKLDGTYRLRTYKDKNETTLGKRTAAENENENPSKMSRTEESDESDEDHA